MADVAKTLIDVARADGFITDAQARALAERLRQATGRLGKFDLVEKLGEGGMGEVWKAWQPDLGRWVAVKLVKSDDAEDVARFIREAQTAAKLTHPHIVSTHEAGEIDGRHYIAMDYIEGDDLKKRRVEVRQALALVRDAAEAVHYAHEHGIVHRDLKPANLMLTKDGRVVVMDFGLAKAAAAPGVSRSGMIVGTPCYMPPEQARGEAVDARSDVYALGATLYELAAGRPPFEGKDVYDVLRKVVEEEPIAPRVERDVAAIIQKAMEKDPARRYASAKALADDLGRELAGEPIAARPASWAYRMKKRIRRQPVLWSLAALLAIAVPGGGGFGIWQLVRVARERGEKLTALEQQRNAERQAGAVDRALALLTEAEDITYDPDVSFEKIEPKARELVGVAEASLVDYPREAKLWYYKGKGHLLLGEEEEAERAFTRAIELEPKDGRSWYERAMIYMGRFQALMYDWSEMDKQTRFAEARQWLDNAAADLKHAEGLGTEESRTVDVWRLYVENKSAQAAEAATSRIAKGGRTEEYYRIRGLLRRGEAGLNDFDAALDRHPGMWRAWFDRGNVHQDDHRPDKAIEDYSVALRINPRWSWAYNNRGVAYADKGRYDRAIEDFDRALAIKNDYTDAYNNRGTAYAAKGQYDRAIEDFDRALAINRDDAEAWNNRGTAYGAKGRYDRAIEDFDRALAIKKDYAKAYCNRGIVYARQGRHDRAIEDFDRALAIKKDYAEAYNNRGASRHARGQYDRAIEDFDRALAFKKDYANAHYNRGNAYAAQGQYDRAIEDYDRALAIKRDYAEACNNRGLSYARKGRYDLAIEDFDRALSIKKDYADAYGNRGTAHHAIGRYDRAIEDYTRALAVAPPDWPHRGGVQRNLDEARKRLKDPK